MVTQEEIDESFREHTQRAERRVIPEEHRPTREDIAEFLSFCPFKAAQEVCVQ
jgi:hypothetical protein